MDAKQNHGHKWNSHMRRNDVSRGFVLSAYAAAGVARRGYVESCASGTPASCAPAGSGALAASARAATRGVR